MSFQNSKKRDQLFLNFEDNKKQVIEPTYAKGGSWLPTIGISNSIYARFTCIMLEYAPINKYYQYFFPNASYHCSCSKIDVETWEYIFMQYKLYDSFWHPKDINIVSFLEFITKNPTSFCFDIEHYTKLVLCCFYCSMFYCFTQR